ncbi:hypothetical protein ACO0KY_08925 [Undibacterium sp. Dicai25W]|uniref:hypothetical protein n=1 Tax=Undibacterium sp. Dicai25W TaxID=3413034 RepID=UPI003BF1D894
MNIWIAALAAVVVQPLVFLARIAPDYLASPQPLYGIGFMLLVVAVVAAAVVLILGIPAFLVLHKLHRESWVSLAMAGLVLGALPTAFSWPSHLEGFSAGQNWHGKYVETYVNGAPTTYAWLTYGEGILFFALHGLVGALVFYAVWRLRERPNKSLQPTASGGS